MTANDLWNLLSCHGPNETVVIDATGLKIGRHGHIEVPSAGDRFIYRLEADLDRDGTIVARTSRRVDL